MLMGKNNSKKFKNDIGKNIFSKKNRNDKNIKNKNNLNKKFTPKIIDNEVNKPIIPFLEVVNNVR